MGKNIVQEINHMSSQYHEVKPRQLSYGELQDLKRIQAWAKNKHMTNTTIVIKPPAHLYKAMPDN